MKKLFIVIGILGGLLVCSAAGQSDLELASFDVILWRSVLGTVLAGVGFLGTKYFGTVKRQRPMVVNKKISGYKHCTAKKTA